MKDSSGNSSGRNLSCVISMVAGYDDNTAGSSILRGKPLSYREMKLALSSVSKSLGAQARFHSESLHNFDTT
jgi:hypothetical protein